MSERYSKLYALPENLYAAGSPVVIAAGSLLKDNQTGKVLAQLKLRNIAKKTIKAVTVCVEPLDTVGKPLGEVVSYQYLDLHADRDIDFGQKSPIALPDATTRSFAVSVSEVIFTDNSIWNSVSLPWEALNKPASLDSLHDSELAKQFRMEFDNPCEILPLEQKDLWFCVCGALNRKEEASCHRCSKTLSTLQSIDMDELRRKKDARRAEERERAEKEAEEVRKKEEAARAKARKVGKVAAIVLPILTVLIVAAIMISGMAKKNSAYQEALALMDAGQYEEAIKAFTALDGYKDSMEQILLAEAAIAELERAAEIEAVYNNAVQLLSSNVSANENEAYYILMELGDYKDAKELLTNFQYQVIAEEGPIGNREYLMFYEYDTRGLLTEKQYDGGISLWYNYDEKGNLVTESEGANYTYYENGTRKSIKMRLGTYSSGATDYITAFFNENGVLKMIKNKSGMSGKETSWSFDCTYSNGSLQALDCTYTNADNEIVDTKHYDFSHYNETVIFDFLLYPTRIAVICVDTSGKQETLYEIKYVSYQKEITISESGRTEYDDNGNPIRINETYFQNKYDEMGNLTQVVKILPDGTKTTYNYIYGYIYTPDAA